MQTATTVPATDKALQQCRSLPHRSSRLMTLRSDIGIEPHLIGLIGRPIDEAGMMVLNKDGPLLHRKMPNSFSNDSVFIDIAFVSCLAVRVRASIHRIGQDLVQSVVGRGHPTDWPGH